MTQFWGSCDPKVTTPSKMAPKPKGRGKSPKQTAPKPAPEPAGQ